MQPYMHSRVTLILGGCNLDLFILVGLKKAIDAIYIKESNMLYRYIIHIRHSSAS